MNHKQAIRRQARTAKNTSGVHLQNKTPIEEEEATKTYVMFSEISLLVTVWYGPWSRGYNKTIRFFFFFFFFFLICAMPLYQKIPKWSLKGFYYRTLFKNAFFLSFFFFFIVHGQNAL